MTANAGWMKRLRGHLAACAYAIVVRLWGQWSSQSAAVSTIVRLFPVKMRAAVGWSTRDTRSRRAGIVFFGVQVCKTAVMPGFAADPNRFGSAAKVRSASAADLNKSAKISLGLL